MFHLLTPVSDESRGFATSDAADATMLKPPQN